MEALDTRQLAYWDQGHSGGATRRLQAIDDDAVKVKGSECSSTGDKHLLM